MASLLLAAAPEVMAELGWHDAAVDVLCRRVGVELGAFYDCFETLDDLFASLYESNAEERLGAFRSAVNAVVVVSPRPAADDVVKCVADAMGRIRSDRTWWLVATGYALRVARHPGVGGTYMRVRRAGRGAMEAEGSAILARLGHRDDADVAERVIRLWVEFHRGTVAGDFLERRFDDADELEGVAWSALVGEAIRCVSSSGWSMHERLWS